MKIFYVTLCIEWIFLFHKSLQVYSVENRYPFSEKKLRLIMGQIICLNSTCFTNISAKMYSILLKIIR